jgi:thiopeptide-type bacteriocin biosynthesis protein
MEIRRSFNIGEEWLYFKIYLRSYFADKVLVKVSNFLSSKLSSGKIEKWFFIRYYDPDFHIRLRLHVTDPDEVGVLMREMNVLLQKEMEERIVSLSIDRYVREIERYDPLCIELMEELFFYDALSVIPVLHKIEEEAFSEDDRWLYGLLAMDKALSDFELDTEGKLNFTLPINSIFSLEFKKDKVLNKQLDKAYREYEGIIIKNMQDSGLFSEMLSEKSDDKKRIISQILQKNKKNELTQEVESIMSSYLHMNCNRLFRIEQRKQEYILYDFLTRFYKKEVYKNK